MAVDCGISFAIEDNIETQWPFCFCASGFELWFVVLFAIQMKQNFNGEYRCSAVENITVAKLLSTFLPASNPILCGHFGNVVSGVSMQCSKPLYY